MKRVSLFLLLLLTSLFSVLALLIVGFLSAPTVPSGSDWFGNMMGHMGSWAMGGTTQTVNSYWIIFGIGLIILIALIVVGIVGLAYFVLFPEIKNRSKSEFSCSNLESTESSDLAYSSVLKTLTGDERKVLDVLEKHQGKYLQKYIRNEAGLSRLKTHRVLVRLADRDIVVLEKVGNTNEVKLSDWLKQKS
jgi:uncharacterized membrane protein